MGALEAPDFPKPGIRVRRDGVVFEDWRIEFRICVWDRATGGAALLKGRGNAEPVGDRERRLNLLDFGGD